MTRFLALLATALCTGCLAFVAPDDDPTDLRDLVAARARWNQQGFANYTMHGRAQCFCVFGGRPVVVTVRNHQVVAVVDSATALPVPESVRGSFRTVDGLFDLVADALQANARRVDVRYDPQLGFPATLWIDYSEMIADEEYGFTIARIVRN